MMKLKNFKTDAVSIIGLVIAAMSVSGYYFSFPTKPAILVSIAELCLGLYLMFADSQSIKNMAGSALNKLKERLK